MSYAKKSILSLGILACSLTFLLFSCLTPAPERPVQEATPETVQRPREDAQAAPETSKPADTARTETARSAPEVPYESIGTAIALGDPQKALDEYQAATKEKPQDAATRLLHARLLLVAGRLAEAREELDLLLSEDAGNADVLFALSLLSALEGGRDGRKAALEKAVAADPKHAEALSALGSMALEAEDALQAGAYFRRALEADAGNLEALVGTGELLHRKGDEKGAAEAYTKAIGVQPDYPFPYVDRARSRRALGDLPGAVSDLTEAIRLDPQYYWSYIDRGRIYIQTGRKDSALEDFSVAVRLDPDQFMAYAYRAEILFQKARHGESLADYRRIVELKPDYYFAYQPLGILLWFQEDWAGARGAFLEAYRYEPDEHAYALLAAALLRRERKNREAVDYLNSVIPTMPRDSWYYETARFLLEPSADFPLVTRIDKEKKDALKARMLFYYAVENLVLGKTRAAQISLLDVEKKGSEEAMETRLGLWELARFKEK